MESFFSRVQCLQARDQSGCVDVTLNVTKLFTHDQEEHLSE
jgi:hypothetical protein